MRTGIADMRKSVDAALFASMSHAVDSLMTSGHSRRRCRASRPSSIIHQHAGSGRRACLSATGDRRGLRASTSPSRAARRGAHKLRAEIAARVESDRIGDMESRRNV
jgi:hypothetical protein